MFNSIPAVLTAEAGAFGGSFSLILMVVAMFAVMYFMMIRPENKRKKAAEQMRSSLKVGDDVTTIGGITGTICAVKENTVVVETGADRVRIEFTKWAISSRGTQTSEEAPDPSKDEKKDKKENKKEK